MIEPNSEVRQIMQFAAQSAERRQRLTKASGPSLETRENHQLASTVISRLVIAQFQFLDTSRKVITEAFPQIYADAQKFVGATNELPWRLIGSEDDTIELISARYNVHWSRNRPRYPEDISAITEVFYQGAETEFQLRQMVSPSNIISLLRSLKADELAADQRLRLIAQSNPLSSEEQRRVSAEEIAQLADLAKLSAWAKNQANN